MATNRRKDSAALFELIDKSTLKVPKNAGALKIPKWWSNPQQPNEGAKPPAVVGGKTPDPVVRTVSTTTGAVTTSATPPAETNPTPTAANAPSIAPATRPPVPEGTDAPSFRPPVRTAAAAPVPTAPDVAPKPPVFAPQTSRHSSRDPSRFGEISPEIQHERRLKLLTIAACAFVGLLLLGIAYYVKSHHGNASVAGNETVNTPGGIAPLDNGNTQPGLQMITPDAHTDNHAANHDNQVSPLTPPSSTGNQAAPAANAEPARVYGPGEYHRPPGLNYLCIVTYPKEAQAMTAAKYLADNGVSVSVERDRGGYYAVISKDGYAKLSSPEAKHLHERVKELGRTHPEAVKRHRAIWQDCYYAKITASAAG